MTFFIRNLSRCLENVSIHANLRRVHVSFNPLWRKYKLDLSNVPVLHETQLEEQFVHGHGPGGQSVNKTLNCVVLIHKTMRITVKCHESRSLERNRQRARELMVRKLDNLMNGENSVENQKKRIDEQRNWTRKLKSRKLAALKAEWKKREKLNTDHE